MTEGRVTPRIYGPSILQIDCNHVSVRPVEVTAKRDVLHVVEHFPGRLRNAGIEASM